jgi:pimeloyl-ACP methyl ester carboxylesterase
MDENPEKSGVAEMKIKVFAAIAGCLTGLILILVVSYLLLNPEKKVLTDQTRSGLPGEFISLSDGVTHYELSGPEDGQVVVLLNGFSIPLFTWERNVTALTDAGFQVLTFDYYGRGYSDRPNVTYNMDLFTRQTDELLTALGIDQKVDIVGISLGGYIAAEFVDQFPERIQKVVLISPQVVTMGEDPLLRIVTLPWLGDYLFTVYIGPNEIIDPVNEYAAYIQDSDWHAREMDAFQYIGTRRALLSTLKNMTGDPFDAYQALGSLGLPVKLLWGDLDQTVPIENAPEVLEAIPQADFSVIMGARHLSCYEEPEIVNPLLIDFLSQ